MAAMTPQRGGLQRGFAAQEGLGEDDAARARVPYDAAIRRQRRELYGDHLVETEENDPIHLSDAEARAEMVRNAGLLRERRAAAAGTPQPETRRIGNANVDVAAGRGAGVWQGGGSAKSANEQLAAMKEANRAAGFGRSHPIGRRRDWIEANNADRAEGARRFDAQIAEYRADRDHAVNLRKQQRIEAEEDRQKAIEDARAQADWERSRMTEQEKAAYEENLGKVKNAWRGWAEDILRNDLDGGWVDAAKYRQLTEGIAPGMGASYSDFLDYLERARQQRQRERAG